MAEKKLEQAQLSIFCGSVAMMLRSGVSAGEACSLFAGDGDAQIVRAAQHMAERIESGESFYHAAEETGVFPGYALGVFRTAEYSGRMDEALERLSEYYARQDTLAQRLRSTLTYPVVLLLLMCGVLAVLVFSVLPMFEKVYGSLTGGLAVSSYAYVTAAALIGRISLVAAAAVSLALLVTAAALRGEKGRGELKKRMETLWVTKKASRLLAESKLADTLATLLASGTDPDSALELAAELTEHSGLRVQLDQCRDRMGQGEGLAMSLFRCGVFPALYGRMLVGGSESGNLGDTLERLSLRLGKDAEAALIGIIDAVEPVLIGFLTVSVGLTLLSVMLPLLGILGAI